MIKKKIKPIKEKPKFHCIYCDEIFEAQRKHATYCSKTCRQYFHYFRLQSSASCYIPAQICLYKMLFKPAYLENNYSDELHQQFLKIHAVEIRNWIHLQRMKNEAVTILQANFN